ncbi:hypothetical protein B0T14DRAFT_430419 [Immersiella caudata]|uniref:Rhodopsin domain-containing protein n=1 Tax=Immersiella caudata TaxID=314043 RepID=A0AA40C0J1_9PEZI|nr:hypothetical protein B0T14DRAFT_430419 [Immersiella caudata]
MSSNSTFPGDAGPPFGPGGPALDTSTQQTGIIVSWAVMTVFATIAVGLRFYTRRFILRVLGVEDWLILAAMVCRLPETFSSLGHHIWTLTPDQIIQGNMENWYSFMFYKTSLACTKMSILFLYLRIMPHGLIRYANFAVMAIIMICNIWVLVSDFVGCTPLAKTWDPSIPGTCLPMLALALGSSVMHIITDFIIFALPIPILVKLKMSFKRKICLVFVFSIGFFVCLISIIRIISIRQLDFSDVTYTFSTVAYWGAVEVNLAIICACLTTLKPLLVHVFPGILGTSHAIPYSLGPSIVHPNGGGVSIQRTTVVQAEQGRFSMLDDESVKSTKALSPEVSYEMDSKAKKLYTVCVTTPSKAHEKLGLH